MFVSLGGAPIRYSDVRNGDGAVSSIMPSLTLKFGLSMGGRGATLRTHDANAVAVILFGFLADRIGSKQAIVIDLDLHEVRSRLEGLSFFVAFVGSAALSRLAPWR